MSYHYEMKLLAFAFLLLAAAPSRAEDALDRVCSNELGLFCRGAAGAARARCLREHRGEALPQCRGAVAELPEEALETAVASEPLGDREALLTGVRGPVYLHRAGAPEDEFVAVSSGTPLLSGDWLRVGVDGAAELALDGKTAVGLSSGTDLSLTSLARARTELSLALGSLTAKVAKLAHGRTFRVRTASAVAAVRGTEFIVEADGAGGESRVAVVDEGVVAVTAATGGAEVLVRPHQETAVRSAAPRPEPVRELSTMRARTQAYAAFRASAARTAQAWTRSSPAALAQARAYLATRPTLSAARLSGVGAQQRTASPAFHRSPTTNTRSGGVKPSAPTHTNTGTGGTKPSAPSHADTGGSKPVAAPHANAGGATTTARPPSTPPASGTQMSPQPPKTDAQRRTAAPKR